MTGHFNNRAEWGSGFLTEPSSLARKESKELRNIKNKKQKKIWILEYSGDGEVYSKEHIYMQISPCYLITALDMQ